MDESEPAREDLDNLLNASLEFAQKMLEEHGEFFPFGFSMTSQGGIEMEAAFTGEEQPASSDLIELMTEGLKAKGRSGTMRAAAICAAVDFRHEEGASPVDAIQVGLEHSTGRSVNVLLPYEKTHEGLGFGELTAHPRDPVIFG